ncbi:MAG: hypothetical protein ABIQ98_04780 [Sphingomicrobium sp.]
MLHLRGTPVRPWRAVAAAMVGALVGGGLAITAASFVTPTYRATAELEFVQAPGTVPLSDAARDARIDGFVETARSLPVATAALADRALAPDRQLMREARALGYGADSRALALIAHIRAERVGATALIRVDAGSADPARAARFAGAVADALIRRSLDDRVATIAPADSRLERDLAASRSRAEQADAALASFRASLDFAAPGTTQGDEEVAAIRAATNLARGDAAAAAARAAAASRHVIVPAATIGQNGTASLAELRRQRAEIVRRIAQLAERFDADYPLLTSARAELAALDRSIATELGGLSDSATADASAARSRAMMLAIGLAGAEQRRARTVGAEAPLARLQRDGDAARDALHLLQQAALQRATERSMARAELRLAAPAAVPLRPVSPDRLFAALFGALALGTATLLAALWAERRRLDALRFDI